METRAANPVPSPGEVEWHALSVRLTHYTWRCLRRRSLDLAEQFAQDAIAQHFDPAYQRWDPSAEPDLFLHLVKIVRGLVSNHWRGRATRRETSWGYEDLVRLAESIEPPQEALVEEQRRRTITTLARRRAENDPIVLTVLDLLDDGVESQAAQVEVSGRTPLEIRNARRRLSTHVAAAIRIVDEEVQHGQA